MPQIQNYDVYVSRMQKSMYDKMFFVDKIIDEHIDTVIDFGCADGELIAHLRSFMPECRFIGYDIDCEMLERAKEKAPASEALSQDHQYAGLPAVVPIPHTGGFHLQSIAIILGFHGLFAVVPKDYRCIRGNLLSQALPIAKHQRYSPRYVVKPNHFPWVSPPYYAEFPPSRQPRRRSHR